MMLSYINIYIWKLEKQKFTKRVNKEIIAAQKLCLRKCKISESYKIDGFDLIVLIFFTEEQEGEEVKLYDLPLKFMFYLCCCCCFLFFFLLLLLLFIHYFIR